MQQLENISWKSKGGRGNWPTQALTFLSELCMWQQFLGDFPTEDSSPAVTLAREQVVPLGITDHAKQCSLSAITDKAGNRHLESY